AGGDVGRELDRAESDRVAVREGVVDAWGGEPAEPDEAEIALRHQGWVVGATGRNDGGIAFTDPELATRRFLQGAESAGVVGVGMGIEQDLHVGDAEAELGDATHDRGGGLGIAPIDQDVPLRPGYEERGDAGVADVVEIPGNPERFVGRPAILRDGRSPEGEQHNQGNRRCPEQYCAPATPEELPHETGRWFQDIKYLMEQSTDRKASAQVRRCRLFVLWRALSDTRAAAETVSRHPIASGSRRCAG